jgi:hypothetical protein
VEEYAEVETSVKTGGNPEDGGDMFLRILGIVSKKTVLFITAAMKTLNPKRPLSVTS